MAKVFLKYGGALGKLCIVHSVKGASPFNLIIGSILFIDACKCMLKGIKFIVR